jgi:hypothetical protein
MKGILQKTFKIAACKPWGNGRETNKTRKITGFTGPL